MKAQIEMIFLTNFSNKLSLMSSLIPRAAQGLVLALFVGLLPSSTQAMCAAVFSKIANVPQTLENLETYLASYDNLNAFLADIQGVERYRQLLKSYMGYDDKFDPVFNKTIEQMKELVEKVPGFADRMWELRSDESIRIEGVSSKLSGIKVQNGAAEKVLKEKREAFKENAGALLDLEAKNEQERQQALQSLENELAEGLRALTGNYSQIDLLITKEGLSKSEKRQLNKDEKLHIHRQRREFFEKRRELLESNPLLNYLRYEVSGINGWLDLYRQPFAESVIEAVSDLSKLNGVAEDLLKSVFGRELSSDVKAALASHSGAWLTETHEQFKRAKKAKKGVQKLGATGDSSDPGSVYHKKKEIIQEVKDDGLFEIPVVDNEAQLIFEVQRQNSDEFTLRPMRVLHSAFGGHLTKECVGGSCEETLTPRRWALGALEGVRVFVAERGGKFNGVLRIVPVEVSSSDGSQTYEMVDMMIRNISDSSVIQSSVTGESARYPIFDSIIDRIPASENSEGFMLSDGRDIKQNTGLAKVFKGLLSVRQAKEVILLSDEEDSYWSIRPVDKNLEQKIAGISFDEIPFNPGGMIYEGMPGDGSQRVVLAPRAQRRKLNQEDLEVMLLKEVIAKQPVAASTVWALAVENDVRLVENDVRLNEQPECYTNFESSLLARAVREMLELGDSAEIASLGVWFGESPQRAENMPIQWSEFQSKINEMLTSRDIDELYSLGRMLEKSPQLAENFAASAVPALIEALKGADYFLGRAAAAVLIQIGEKAEPAVPALIEVLKDKKFWVSRSAAEALGRMFEKSPQLAENFAASAVPALIEAVNRGGFESSAAAEALGRMFEKSPQLAENFAASAVPALIEALKNKDWAVRVKAAKALGQIGEKAEPAVPALIEALKDRDESFRRNAAIALGQIGEKAASAVPALIDALFEALGQIGEQAAPAVPALINPLIEALELIRGKKHKD